MTAVNAGAKPVPWTSKLSLSDLDERVENAMRRVSGSIGFDISHDRGKMRSMKETAARAFEAGMESGGPWFMRMGQGALEAGTFSLGQGLDLKAVGGEILAEFYAEGTAAFQAARAALYADALAHMQGQKVDEECRKTTLAAAEATFSLPAKDAFSHEALPLVAQGIAPATQSAAIGLIGFLGLILLTRMPPVAMLGGIGLGCAAYFTARGRLRGRSEQLLRVLPRKLYQLMASELKTNVRRYEETVNAALKAL